MSESKLLISKSTVNELKGILQHFINEGLLEEEQLELLNDMEYIINNQPNLKKALHPTTPNSNVESALETLMKNAVHNNNTNNDIGESANVYGAIHTIKAELSKIPAIRGVLENNEIINGTVWVDGSPYNLDEYILEILNRSDTNDK